MSNPKPGMNAREFRTACIHANFRRLLTGPFLAFRLAMLKMGLKTLTLDGLTIEAIPRYWLGMPQKCQYHVCLRSAVGKGRLVADVVVSQHRYQGLNAFEINVLHAHLPSHAIDTLWIRRDMVEP